MKKKKKTLANFLYNLGTEDFVCPAIDFLLLQF